MISCSNKILAKSCDSRFKSIIVCNKCLFVGPCPALAHRSHPRPRFSGRNFRINWTSPCLGNAFAASRFSSRRSPQMTSQGMRSRSWKWLDQYVRQDFRMYQQKVVTSKYLPESSKNHLYYEIFCREPAESKPILIHFDMPYFFWFLQEKFTSWINERWQVKDARIARQVRWSGSE